MSAFVVGKEHIDAMVTFGLKDGRPQGSVLRWFYTPITEEERDQASRAGIAITEGDVDLATSRSQELRPETADRVGAMLWAENVRSVCYRYNEPEDAPDLPGPSDFGIMDVLGYHFEPNGGFSPVEILSALRCYEYQSCEHPGWVTSEARQFCEALTDRAVSVLPGMDEAPWEITVRRPSLYSRP